MGEAYADGRRTLSRNEFLTILCHSKKITAQDLFRGQANVFRTAQTYEVRIFPGRFCNRFIARDRLSNKE